MPLSGPSGKQRRHAATDPGKQRIFRAMNVRAWPHLRPAEYCEIAGQQKVSSEQARQGAVFIRRCIQASL